MRGFIMFSCISFALMGPSWLPACRGDAAGQELIQKNLQAIGGLTAIENLRTAHFTWNITIMIIQGTVTEWYAAPDKYYVEIDTPVASQKQCENGDTKWTVDQNDQLTLKEQPPDPPPAMVLPYFHYLFPKPGREFIDSGEEKHNGTLFRILEIHDEEDENRRLYLDPETWLIAFEQGEEDGIPVSTAYEDYKLLDGVMIPHSYTQQAGIAGMPPSVFELKAVEFNIDPPEAIFQPPENQMKDYGFSEGAETTVPINVKGEHLLVDVMVNQSGPYTFLLDSGAGATVISRQLVDSLKLETQEGMQALGIGGVESVAATEVEHLSVGGFHIDGLRMYATDMAQLDAVFKMHIDGVLGFDIFVRSVLKIDYLAKILSIIDKDSFHYTGEGTVITGEIKGNLIHIPGTLDGEYSGDFRVDTGAGGGVHLHGPFVMKNHLADKYPHQIKIQASGVGGNETSWLTRMESLTLGDITIDQPLGTISKNSGGALAMTDSIGTIGNGIWSKFTVIFNYAQNQLILEPNGKFPQKMRIDRAGIEFQDSKGKKVIYQILNGSPASENGIKEGDVILRVNKLDASKLSETQLRRILSGPENTDLKLILQRKDEEITKTIQLRDYL